MMQKKQQMLIGLAVLALSTGPSAAQSQSLRCQAAELRKEASSIECVGRCDDRYADTNKKGDRIDVAARITTCASNCNDRYDTAMVRLHRFGVCRLDEPAPPDLMACEAKLLRAEARAMACQSRCENRSDVLGFDAAECMGDCDARHGLVRDQILASDICQGYSDGTDEAASN
jgi:hypothetical protein